MAYKILIVAGVFLIGLGYLYRALQLRVTAKAARQWPQTKGKVLSSSVEEDAIRNFTGKASMVYVMAIKYEYSVTGQTLIGDRLTFGNPTYDYLTASRIRDKYAVDSEVNVYYNPVKPAESVVVPYAREAMRSMIPGIFFIASGIIISVLMLIFR